MNKFKIPFTVEITIVAESAAEAVERFAAWRHMMVESTRAGNMSKYGIVKMSVGPSPRHAQLAPELPGTAGA